MVTIRTFVVWFLFVFLIPTILFSQDFEPPEMRFGKGIEESLKTETWDIVEEDEAIFLIDKIHYTYKVLADKITFQEDYHARIKILDKAAADEGNIKIIYKHGDQFQKVEEIEAASYNLVNGELVEQRIKKKDIFKKELDDEYTELSFAIPDVKEGTIIEYQYTKYSRGRVRPGTWYFSKQYPTLYSQVSFNVPKWYSFSYYHRGFTPFVYEKAEGVSINLGAQYSKVPGTQSVWGKVNVKPYKDEDYTANIHDFREQLQFRLNQVTYPGSNTEIFNTTWEKLNDNLLEDDYADQQKDKKFIEDVVQEVTARITDEKEKIKAIYDYVVANIKIEKEGWVYTSAPVKKVLKDKSGNIADANLLLVNMLQSAGVDAYPMLISTRDDGYIDKLYANMQAFTYPVAYVKLGEDHLIMNATSAYRPYYLSRDKDYNLYGWVVREKNPGWVDIENLAPQSKRFYKIDAKLSTNGDYTGSVSISSDNFSSVNDRMQIDKEGIVKRLEFLYDGESEIQFSNEKSSNTDNDYETFTIDADFEINGHAQIVGNFLYFNPILFQRIEDNPFKQKNREYPVDFSYPQTAISVINVDLPEGYHLEETPEPILVNFGNILKLKIVSQQLNGVLNILIEEKLLQTIIMPEDYSALQKYIDRFITETSKQYTLKKAE